MRALTRLRAFLSTVVRRSQFEREMADELQFHLSARVDTLVRSGLTKEAAHRQARLEFGSFERYKDQCRHVRDVRWLDDLRADLIYAWRMLCRAPAFAATAILSLALGIGANILVFSIVNTLVFKPLPVANPTRVVTVEGTTGRGFGWLSFPAYRDLRDRNRTLTDLLGFRIAMMDVDAGNRPMHAWGYLATRNYFDLLGVQPFIGRVFHAADDRAPGASPYAVLSYDYWHSQFGGNPSILGSSIRINRLPYTVLGVAPSGFHGTEMFYRPDLWVPMMMQAQIEVGNPWLENPNTWNTMVAGRLKPDISTSAAVANLNAVAADLARERPRSDEGLRLTVSKPGLLGNMLGAPLRAFWIGVMVLAGLVLTAACANLASTLAARGADRQRELAIRLSMGAGRGRIIRQLLTETILVACIGGTAGGFIATFVARTLSNWRLPVPVPIQFDVRPDVRVWLFAFAVTLVTGLLFGLAPARQAARTDPAAALRATDGVNIIRRGWRLRDVLIVVQVALSVVLVASCLVALRGLQRALTLPIGMTPNGVTLTRFDLGTAGYAPESGEQLRRRAVEAIAHLPGVQRVAYGNSLPLSIDQSYTQIYPENAAGVRPSQTVLATYYEVSPDFLSTLGIRLLQGRDVAWTDTRTAPRVAVVNETFVRTVLHGGDALGGHFRRGPAGPLFTVIGVVADGKYASLTEAPAAAVFEPMLQAYNTTTALLVKSSRPPEDVVTDVRRVMAGLDPQLPLFGAQSVDQMLGFALLPMRAASLSLGLFGLLAVVLAATGLHGLVAYAVARRRREIGIRVAIGATAGSILTLVLSRIAGLVGMGAAVGFALTFVATPLLANIVYQASPLDPLALGGVMVIMVIVGIGSCGGPAWRSLRISPTLALRAE